MTTMTFDTTMFETLHKQEAWKYTNVSAIAKVEFGSGGSNVSAETISGYDIASKNPFVVFVNGTFNEDASRLIDGIEINAGKNGTVAARGDSCIPRGESDSLTITGSQKKTCL